MMPCGGDAAARVQGGKPGVARGGEAGAAGRLLLLFLSAICPGGSW